MRRRDSALKRSRSAMVVFPQAWIWTAIIMAMAICAAIPLLYQRNRQVWLHSTEGLRTLRQARTDLAKGFLHASLGDDPASPFNRDQGLALIAQATSQFDDLGEPPPEGVELAALAEFRQEAARFRDLVMAQRQRDPGQETRIRIAYHRLESEADQIDSAIERALMKRDEQFDTQQRLLISMAALLLGICAVAVARPPPGPCAAGGRATTT